MSENIPSRGHLGTERPNPRTMDLDELSVLAALEKIQAEDAELPAVLAAARPSIAAAIELITEHLRGGGRLLYVGAGTSGRLGVLDAVECPPTFQSSPDLVQGVLAGGESAMFRSVEGAEDSRTEAQQLLVERQLTANDVVFGISAGGTTPFVLAALEFAAQLGAATVMLACVPFEEVPDRADVSIRLDTGPEVLQGSTRMKAGTATKMALNSISTLVMTGLGKVHGNRMVDVQTLGNDKLRDRGIRMIAELCELERDEAARWLDRAGGQVKLAVLMQHSGLDAATALARLSEVGGVLRTALARSDAAPPSPS